MWRTRDEIITFLAEFQGSGTHYVQAQNAVIIDILFDIRELLENNNLLETSSGN